MLLVLKLSDTKADASEKEVEVNELPKGCQMPKVTCVNTKGTCFWIEGWRTALCTCEECKSVRYLIIVNFFSHLTYKKTERI